MKHLIQGYFTTHELAESAVRAGNYLVLAHGDEHQIMHSREVLVAQDIEVSSRSA